MTSSSSDRCCLRLILGDQLNPLHPWFSEVSKDNLYVMMEVRQETDYVLHHAQKIVAIFAAMRDFARQIEEQGHRIFYFPIDASDNQQSITANIDLLLRRYRADRFEYQSPDEWRLREQLSSYAATLSVATKVIDTYHFYTSTTEVAAFFGGRRHWMMESFYRDMRRKHNVLMDSSGRPAGGRWNFDESNRAAWPGLPREPDDARPEHDHQALWDVIVAANVKSFGEPHAQALRWPLNRTEALAQLDRFITDALPDFGHFQDAMSQHTQRLFHSLLSFALNTKMLNPSEVVERAEDAWRNGNVPLSSAEGFIRQILGWREYVRGVYWAKMPAYADSNVFDHQQDLPSWFWTGKTLMRCMQHAIGQSLDQAHAHHIQRLMIIGNFALLAALAPDQVHRWYLGVYIDAFEWVEMPNTLGLSQFADGGLLATKPYVSSAAYIHRMSDYCRGCFYNYKERTGPRACPYNALYWDFFIRRAAVLHDNPRLSMVYRKIAQMSKEEQSSLQQRAMTIQRNLEHI